MSFTSEVNFVDMFLQQDDPFSTDDMYGTKNNEQKDDMNWLNDDFLNSFLDPNFQSSFKLPKCNNDIFNTDTSSVSCITENISDNGVSLSGELGGAKISDFNTGISVLSDNQFVNRDVLNETTTENIANSECSNGDSINEKTDEFVNANEVISCEEVSVLNDAVVLADVIDGSSYEISSDGNEDLIFVSDINSEDDRSLSSTLSEKQFDVKKNAVLIRKSPMRFKNLKQFVGVRRPYKVFQNNTVRDDLVSTDDAASDDSDAVYSKLNLTAEEKKLMVKEGIVLPSRYPLTKAEEKELKRIRRKIRNKISAQDSRRRKKEYVDGLEERVKKCSEENAKLMKYIKQLQSQNIALASQVRKLQSASTATTTTTTTPGKNVAQQPQSSTCLLVLFLSLVMVLAPVLKNNTLKNNSVTDDEGISLSDSESSIASGHSSNVYSGLNSDSANNETNEPTVLVDGKSFDISKFDTSSMDTVSSIALDPDGVVSDSIVLRDHDYFRINNKRPASSIGSDSDDLWPTPPSSPPLKMRRSMAEFEGDFIKKLNKSRNSDNNPIIFELSE